jgi:hypothetical protein
MQTNYDLLDKLNTLKIPINGIYNKDQFLNLNPQQGFYIINLDDDKDSNGIDKEGTHWTTLLIENNKAVYFDSFGFPPPRQIDIFLQKYKPYMISQKQIQNVETIICGSYVLYFIWFMYKNRKAIFSLKNRFERFLNVFSDEPKKNREILQNKLKLLKIDLYQ